MDVAKVLMMHALVVGLLEKCHVVLDGRSCGGAMLMDQTAFDSLNYNLLIAKLRPHQSYFSNRWQWTKINTSFSSLSELITGVPECSISWFRYTNAGG